MSRMFGWVSEVYIPFILRPYLFSCYAWVYGANLDELSEPVDSYSSLCDFFTRRLKDGVRPIDRHQALVAPADGTVLTVGRLSSCRVEQIKGVTYSLMAFFGDLNMNSTNPVDINHNNVFIKENVVSAASPEESWIECKKKLIHNPGNELYQCVIYLAPGDYHRFHSPTEWNIKMRRHFQGELFSVNPRVARWIQDLFCLNERAVYFGEWEHGFFSMTAVGATNVGSIRVFNDTTLHTNTRKWRNCRHKDQKLNLNWTKGEEIGEFRMGSTIVLIFEAPPNFSMDLSPGDKVRVGKSITSCSAMSR